MPRIFLPGASAETGRITVRGEKAHYLSSVLRCRNGERIFVSNAQGILYITEIIRISQKSVTLAIMDISDDSVRESPLRITLFQGVLKGAKMDLVIQKATELGVRRIVPLITERSQLRATRKCPRWRKIAEEASRVAGRPHVPSVCDAVPFKRLIAESHGGPAENSILFWEEGGKALSAVTAGMTHNKPLSVFIGPEGGFSHQETALASDNGMIICTLGSRTLRAETAAISVLAILQYVLGDMGDPKEIRGS